MGADRKGRKQNKKREERITSKNHSQTRPLYAPRSFEGRLLREEGREYDQRKKKKMFSWLERFDQRGENRTAPSTGRTVNEGKMCPRVRRQAKKEGKKKGNARSKRKGVRGSPGPELIDDGIRNPSMPHGHMGGGREEERIQTLTGKKRLNGRSRGAEEDWSINAKKNRPNCWGK